VVHPPGSALLKGRFESHFVERTDDMTNALQLAVAQNYPLLNIFWTTIMLFLWILWIFLLIYIITDVFRSNDLSGWAKALWTIFIILLPFLGVLIYLIARGDTMQKRQMREYQETDQAMRSYIKDAAGTQQSTADEVTKLASLRDQGVLTEQEFLNQKQRLLA